MSVTEHRTTPTSPDAVLAAVEALAPEITARAPETEIARRLPLDLLDGLRSAGCFRLLLPPSHGGIGADLPSALRVFEALARADGSTGWTVAIGATSWCDVAGLPAGTFAELFESGPDAILAGVFSPSGHLEAVDGGYRIRGRWPFASGCEHADWLWVNALEGVVDGVPQLRIAVLEPAQVTIEDTWDVVGLRGTGSHHLRVDAVVPADRTCPAMGHDPCLDAPIVRIPAPQLFATGVASIALGIARGALDDIGAIAADRMPLLAAAPLAANPTYQRGLAVADADVRAAALLLHDTATGLWEAGVRGVELSLEERARARAAAVWVTDRAASVVETAYRAGGSAALYAEHPLQRRLRDVAALRQHFLVREDTLVTAGSLLAGGELSVPVF